MLATTTPCSNWSGETTVKPAVRRKPGTTPGWGRKGGFNFPEDSQEQAQVDGNAGKGSFLHHSYAPTNSNHGSLIRSWEMQWIAVWHPSMQAMVQVCHLHRLPSYTWSLCLSVYSVRRRVASELPWSLWFLCFCVLSFSSFLPYSSNRTWDAQREKGMSWHSCSSCRVANLLAQHVRAAAKFSDGWPHFWVQIWTPKWGPELDHIFIPSFRSLLGPRFGIQIWTQKWGQPSENFAAARRGFPSRFATH